MGVRGAVGQIISRLWSKLSGRGDGGTRLPLKCLPVAEGDLNFDVADDGDWSVSSSMDSATLEGEVAPEGKAAPAKKLIVEGWRFLAHSYAIVNQWQLLSLHRRADVSLKVRDLPFCSRHWHSQEGLFEPVGERLLRSLPAAEMDENADVTLRISFPFDFFAIAPSCAQVVGGPLKPYFVSRSLR